MVLWFELQSESDGSRMIRKISAMDGVVPSERKLNAHVQDILAGIGPSTRSAGRYSADRGVNRSVPR